MQQEADRQEAADVHCSLQGTVWRALVLTNVNMLLDRSGNLKTKLHSALEKTQFNLFVWERCRWTVVNIPLYHLKTVMK